MYVFIYLFTCFFVYLSYLFIYVYFICSFYFCIYIGVFLSMYLFVQTLFYLFISPPDSILFVVFQPVVQALRKRMSPNLQNRSSGLKTEVGLWIIAHRTTEVLI